MQKHLVRISIPKSSGRSAVMEFNMTELLFPKLSLEEFVRQDGTHYKREVGEVNLNRIKKILRLIRQYGTPDQWEDLRQFITENPVRRWQKYLRTMEYIEM